LSRVGAKKQASYRIVVADSTAPRDGKVIAILGHYNPLTDPYTLKVDEEKTVGWLRNGAQPSETARGLLVKAGVIAAFEQARKSAAPARKKAAAGASEETKARRQARAKRTEAPRLVRPAAKAAAEGEPAAASAAKPASATRAAAAKAKPAAKAATKTAAKPARARAKPAKSES